jgi:polyhydroxyalkanoate synthesis repressor PhaR
MLRSHMGASGPCARAPKPCQGSLCICTIGVGECIDPFVQVRKDPLMVESSPSRVGSADATMVGDGDVVVLKKYGNRRIYDTRASRYVTLGEVEAMVQQGTEIVVKDAKTGEDITKEILMQLLIERDGAKAALPTSVLRQAVRLANSPLKDGLVKAVQEGLDTFMASQRSLLDAQRAFSSQLGRMNPWIQPQVTPAALWNPFAPPPPARPTPTTTEPAPSAPPAPAPSAAAADVDMLRAELAQTQALVQRLLERELSRDATPDAAPATKPAKKAKATTTKATKKKAPTKSAPK